MSRKLDLEHAPHKGPLRHDHIWLDNRKTNFGFAKGVGISPDKKKYTIEDYIDEGRPWIPDDIGIKVKDDLVLSGEWDSEDYVLGLHDCQDFANEWLRRALAEKNDREHEKWENSKGEKFKNWNRNKDKWNRKPCF